jgi:hypothetical protein
MEEAGALPVHPDPRTGGRCGECCQAGGCGQASRGPQCLPVEQTAELSLQPNAIPIAAYGR